MLVKPDLLLMGMRTLKIAISKIQTIQNIHRKKNVCIYKQTTPCKYLWCKKYIYFELCFMPNFHEQAVIKQNL